MSPNVRGRLRQTVAPSAHRLLNRLYRERGQAAFGEAYQRARETGTVRVNIGSGRRPAPGWINTDVVRQGRIYLDATLPWPVEPETVDLVYADNVIEHITLAQTQPFLRHAFRAMRPGAVIRLATPDVEAVARQYLDNGELALLGMQRNAEYGHPMKYSVELVQQVFVGAKHYLGFCHDFHSLSTEMREAGFRVQRVSTGQSDHPDLRDLEARTHPAEAATQLVVEGVR